MSHGQRLKLERERLGLSQPQFGGLAGVGKTTVISWEKGLTSPTVSQLALLAEGGMDVLYVATGKLNGGLLSAEEQTLIEFYRRASDAVRRAALGALIGASPSQSQGVTLNNRATGVIQAGAIHGSTFHTTKKDQKGE